MKATTVGLATVGCKLNQYETEGIAELMEGAGFRVVPFDGAADVYVVNTCTVTARSDARSRQMLRRAARANPRALVVATGCYAQRDAEALRTMPEVHLVAGNAEKARLASLVRGLAAARGEGETARRAAGCAAVAVGTLEAPAFEPLDVARFRGHTRAFVKVQDGCDGHCAYCAVPGARGPARSRPFADVVAQAARLAASGHREVVLTGVHIGAYSSPEGGLAEVLRAVAGVPGIDRVRLGSVEAQELTSALASAVASLERVARHIHVPLESGSDRVLTAMRRRTTRDGYVEAVRRVTDVLPDCGLGADVMVGFPGETDEDFEETVSLVRALPFSYLHVFAYSPRPGTEAAGMPDCVPPEVKSARSRVLREVGRLASLSFRRRLVGSSLLVLAEGPGARGGGTLTGLSSNYVRVEFRGPAELAGRMVAVRVDHADERGTRGTALGEGP
jgi:threonylcarbamoyladenosine tRNA methylthiotransferase MtaB